MKLSYVFVTYKLAVCELFAGPLQTLLAEALTFSWLVEKSVIRERLLIMEPILILQFFATIASYKL